MTKIILFVALVTLMCVSGSKRADGSPDGKRSAPPINTRNTRGITAQNNNNWAPGFAAGFWPGNWPSVPNFPDFVAAQRDSILNREPGSNENYHAASMTSTLENGKVVTSIYQNDNGKKKEFTITN